MKYRRGTYIRIASQLGYSYSLVASVAQRRRRNARIELALAQEELDAIKTQNKLKRLRQLINKHKKCATSNPTSSN